MKKVFKFNKAAMPAAGVALATTVGAMFDLDPEFIAALGVVLSTFLVWLVPNAK